jgi:hypothetical protein
MNICIYIYIYIYIYTYAVYMYRFISVLVYVDLRGRPPSVKAARNLLAVIFCVLCLQMSAQTAVKNKTESPPIYEFILIRNVFQFPADI